MANEKYVFVAFGARRLMANVSFFISIEPLAWTGASCWMQRHDLPSDATELNLDPAELTDLTGHGSYWMEKCAHETLWLHFQAGGLREFSLPGIEGKKGFRTAFKGDGDVKKINGSLPFRRRVLLAEFVGSAEGVCPCDGVVNQQSFAQVFVDPMKRRTPLASGNLAAGRSVS